jgi:hypothetical protein
MIDQQHGRVEQEKRAEQAALPFVYGVNFTDCLRINGVATGLVVDGKTVQAHRIYGAWQRFLRAEGLVTGDLSEAEHLTQRMFTWITTSYSATYQAIATEDERQWLQIILRFVVMRRIMENKYTKWVTSGSGFVDEAVARKIAEVYRFQYEMPTVARLIHATLLRHSDHEAEEWEKKLAQEIIAGIFDLLRVDRLGTLPPVKKGELLIEGKEAL